MIVANYASILLLLSRIPGIHGTTCAKIEPTSLYSGYMMSHHNKKFQSGNVIRLGSDSEMLCYQMCLNECLCHFANYHEYHGKKKSDNCELVKYSSCTNKSGVTSIEAVGWTGIQLRRVSSISCLQTFLSTFFIQGEQIQVQNCFTMWLVETKQKAKYLILINTILENYLKNVFCNY